MAASHANGADRRRRLGIFAKTFERPSVDDVFAAVAAHGLATVQFNMASAGLEPVPEAVPKAVARAIAAAAAQRGIAIAALSGTVNLIHPDKAARREGLARLRRLIASAGALGTGIVTLCTGTRDPLDPWRAHPDNDRPAAWDDLVESLGSALETASASGIVLGVEPEPGNVASSAEKARRLLDEMASRHLGIVLDPANLLEECTAAASRAKVDEALDRLGGDVVLAHAKDRDRQGTVRPPGQGVVDFRHFIAGLDRIGFGGAIVMHGFAEAEVDTAVAHLRPLLGG
jgi:sugar phosphate isomerase/epimerase